MAAANCLMQNESVLAPTTGLASLLRNMADEGNADYLRDVPGVLTALTHKVVIQIYV